MRSIMDKSKGYKRIKTVNYTVTEIIRPLKKEKKEVQLSFPFPELNGQGVKATSKPVIRSIHTTLNNSNIK